MKDAFGSAFIIKIMMVFMIVFISFMTVAINFAKVFRVKNTVINILERYSNERDDIDAKIDSYLSDVGYSYDSNDEIKKECEEQMKHLTVKDDAYQRKSSVCVIPLGDENNTYYKVTSYIVIDFPLFHYGLVLPFSGESSTIVS